MKVSFFSATLKFPYHCFDMDGKQTIMTIDFFLTIVKMLYHTIGVFPTFKGAAPYPP